MNKVIRIPGNETLRLGKRGNIRALFENVGIPGYFTIATDIPPQMFDMEMPLKDYYLTFKEERVNRHPEPLTNRVFAPTIEQVLWAIGFMSTELGDVITEKSVRFAHHPFRSHKCPWKQSVAWRQIVATRIGIGYSVSTVCVQDEPKDVLIGYHLQI